MTRLFLRFFYHIQTHRNLSAMIIALLVLSAPVSAEQLNRVSIVSEGNQHDFSVEIMRAPEQRARGLMHVKQMDAKRGMLFDFGENVFARMWMKNTYIPLDMIFARDNGIITNIAKNTVPHSEDVLSSIDKVRYVLEINAGLSSSLGIKPGDRMIVPAP